MKYQPDFISLWHWTAWKKAKQKGNEGTERNAFAFNVLYRKLPVIFYTKHITNEFVKQQDATYTDWQELAVNQKRFLPLDVALPELTFIYLGLLFLLACSYRKQ